MTSDKMLTVIVVGLLVGVTSSAQDVLMKEMFGNGAKGWTKVGQASISGISRRAKAGSLLIKQWKDEEQGSHWLSPAIKNPGKPVKITFWAADNYYKLTDFSYSAVVNALDYDKAGKELGTSWYLKSMPWDQGRKSDLWGSFLEAGLTWKYYEAIHHPKGETFKLKFHWPKPIVRGECYLTDMMVTVATPEDIANAALGVKKEEEKSRFALELTAPVLGNLFYADDPIEFEALLFSTDKNKIGALEDPRILYEITDFENFFIARGEVAFDKAVPVADKKFYKSRAMPRREFNLRQTLPIPAVAARQVGREFFIRAELQSGGEIVASDTVTYGVVDPRKIDPKDYGKCRFSSTYFSEGFTYARSKRAKQSISVKTGISRMHLIDYYWIRCQPEYPGPITFKTKLPSFPPVISCPNIEQERSSDTWLKNMVPPECLIPDPGKPGRLTFKIDPYVAYMVAYVRHNRDAIEGIVPSGLERPVDARTIELHKKAYKAIKKEWPELPVGMMLYGLPMNPSKDVDIFLDNKLYDFADFIDTHIYASSVDWTEWHRLQRAYRKMGRTPPPLMSTEFCRVGGSDQILHSRDTVASHLDAFANGMGHVYYFNQCNEGKLFLKDPFLREPTDLGGDQTSGFMYMQRVDRPRVSEHMVFAKPERRWGRCSWGHEAAGDTLMPVLQAMTYYNLVQNFEIADYRATFRPSPNTIAYVFDRGDRTVCAMWLAKPVPVETLLIQGDVSYAAQDLFGRTERITPVSGASLITVDDNPMTLVFDKRVVLFDQKAKIQDIRKIDGGPTVGPVARGTKGAVNVTIPPVFGKKVRAKLIATVDGTWPDARPKKVTVKKDSAGSARLPFRVPLDRQKGTYPLTIRMNVGEKVVGLLRAPLLVDELLKLDIVGGPMTVKRDPEVLVAITSLRDVASKGVVELSSVFFADGLRSKANRMRYNVPARGTVTFRFAVAREQVNLTAAYDVLVRIVDDSGIKLSHTEEVAFRATPHVPGAIVVDGKLDDWKLDDRLAIPFARQFTGWGKKWGGSEDISGVFYTTWDDEYLYLAAVITDDSAVTRANDVNIWQDDNIMLGLYPWGWKKGTPLNSGYYREHLGRCKDGPPRIFRVGNVAVGPKTAEGAKIAVTRTKDGYVYEWAYPKACIAPIALEKGGRFRLSLFEWDVDETGDPKKPYTRLGGIQIGGFNANIDARPDKWREFVLTQ